MSTLTEEQRQKIEENRKKALEKRAAILKNRVANNSNFGIQPPTPNLLCFNVSESDKEMKYNNSWFKQQNGNNVSNPLSSDKRERETDISITGNAKPSLFYSNNKGLSIKSSTSNEAKAVFSGKKITGNFALSSKSHFIVNLPYQAQAIEIFKTMPSKQYDMISHKWSFDISDHSKLSAALNQLRPVVCVSPLPSYVFQALKKASSYPAINSIDLMSIDPLLLEALLPFQREGVCFGISRNGRVLIADDMGLGKTIQALGIASYYRNEWPLLVVTPSSVRYSWAEAVQRWISSISSYEVVVVNSAKDPIDGSVIVMSYDLLSRRGQELKDMNFQIVIMDESHMLKNFKSARYKAALPIMKSARRVILLSGTPAVSRPSELYAQLSAIDPKLFPNFQNYGIRYCNGKDLSWGWDYSGSSNMEELQVILTSTLMIRRMKSDVLSQLPSKQRMSIILDPSSIKSNTKVMQAMASQLKQTSLKSRERHGALLHMFSETAFVKAKAVCDYIKELLVEEGKKFLVFAHHKVMMNKISNLCDELEVHYIRIDGNTSSEDRQTLVDSFQSRDDIRVAVLSITAANTGITLTAAQLVVFAELYWNPGPLVQAEDRAHRIGQDDSVLVQYLVAKNTADDYIWPLIQSKLDILGKVGLSKENFGAASSTNQKAKVEDEGILKYFSKLTDDEMFEEVGFTSTSSLSSMKRKSSEVDSD